MDIFLGVGVLYVCFVARFYQNRTVKGTASYGYGTEPIGSISKLRNHFVVTVQNRTD